MKNKNVLDYCLKEIRYLESLQYEFNQVKDFIKKKDRKGLLKYYRKIKRTLRRAYRVYHQLDTKINGSVHKKFEIYINQLVLNLSSPLIGEKGKIPNLLRTDRIDWGLISEDFKVLSEKDIAPLIEILNSIKRGIYEDYSSEAYKLNKKIQPSIPISKKISKLMNGYLILGFIFILTLIVVNIYYFLRLIPKFVIITITAVLNLQFDNILALILQVIFLVISYLYYIDSVIKIVRMKKIVSNLKNILTFHKSLNKE